MSNNWERLWWTYCVFVFFVFFLRTHTVSCSNTICRRTVLLLGSESLFLLLGQTHFLLMVDKMGAQHEQLEANPIPWLEGFAHENQAPRQPKVWISNLHWSHCIVTAPLKGLQFVVTVCWRWLCSNVLTVMIANNNIPMKTLETESHILKCL